MPKISQKIIQKKFPQVKGGFLGGAPGLEPASVNYFLQELLEDVKSLEKRNDELESRLRSKTDDTRSEQIAMITSNPESSNQIEEMEEIIRREQKKAENMESFYKRLILRGEAEIEMIKEEAREQAKAMLVEAEEKAKNLIREANASLEDKAREARNMIDHSEEVRKKLQSIAKFIESAV